jgi:hypothetical protein
MDRGFQPGDFLVFQLESGYGLIRVLAIDKTDQSPVWHLLIYEELFGDVESAEEATKLVTDLHPWIRHVAMTDRAFERTPAARLGNSPLTEIELQPYVEWLNKPQPHVVDRSVLLMLGLR